MDQMFKTHWIKKCTCLALEESRTKVGVTDGNEACLLVLRAKKDKASRRTFKEEEPW